MSTDKPENNMKRISSALAILLVLAAAPFLSVAAERRVVKGNPLADYPYDTWGNAAASIQMAIDAADPGAVYNSKVWNTIIWSNKASGGIVNYAGATALTNCCTTPVPAAGWDPGNTAQAPGFVNAAAGDYHLAAGSPCTEQGMNFAWMQNPGDARSRDLDGNLRILPRGGRVDIGAFERNIPLGTILGIR